jgi:invasion protein IalB
MTMSNPARWLATALTVAALALASQLAQAHGSHHHERDAAPHVAGSEGVLTPDHVALPSVHAAWTQTCPDGSGGDCCCKHHSVTTGTAKVALVNSGGWARPAAAAPAGFSAPPVETFSQQFITSRALPRAPPFFS